jgi:hypothetical protein
VQILTQRTRADAFTAVQQAFEHLTAIQQVPSKASKARSASKASKASKAMSASALRCRRPSGTSRFMQQVTSPTLVIDSLLALLECRCIRPSSTSRLTGIQQAHMPKRGK